MSKTKTLVINDKFGKSLQDTARKLARTITARGFAFKIDQLGLLGELLIACGAQDSDFHYTHRPLDSDYKTVWGYSRTESHKITIGLYTMFLKDLAKDATEFDITWDAGYSRAGTVPCVKLHSKALQMLFSRAGGLDLLHAITKFSNEFKEYGKNFSPSQLEGLLDNLGVMDRTPKE